MVSIEYSYRDQYIIGAGEVGTKRHQLSSLQPSNLMKVSYNAECCAITLDRNTSQSLGTEASKSLRPTEVAKEPVLQTVRMFTP